MIEKRWLKSRDGVDVGVRSAGRDGPAIIFVHGVGSTAAIWDDQLDALASRFRCFAVELRGNGAAAADPDPQLITRAGFVQDVLTVADDAAIDRFHLVGCSLGGVVGFELWRTAADRIASLTIADSFAAYPNGEQTAQTIIEGVEAAGNLREFAKARVGRVLAPDAPPKRYTETI
ncbi:MAG: alpha/beta fold hydrolase, partial [Candidatus Eremiobacteraeota bacterium]|nr:alpha/beta fold hydrolase [Candidatus Eremiobacteraeota bacterium]